MAIVIDLIDQVHDFVKTNGVTVTAGVAAHDVYECQRCGLTGKRFGLSSSVRVDGRYKKLAKTCTGVTGKQEAPVQIRITNCQAFGVEFDALTPGSIHDTVEPPPGHDRSRGEWVMGKTEPVLVLVGEFVVHNGEG